MRKGERRGGEERGGGGATYLGLVGDELSAALLAVAAELGLELGEGFLIALLARIAMVEGDQCGAVELGADGGLEGLLGALGR